MGHLFGKSIPILGGGEIKCVAFRGGGKMKRLRGKETDFTLKAFPPPPPFFISMVQDVLRFRAKHQPDEVNFFCHFSESTGGPTTGGHT